MSMESPTWKAQWHGWRTLRGLRPKAIDLERIALIRAAPLHDLAQADKIEKLLLNLGLNDEGIDEFPAVLHPFCGSGLRIWQYPSQFSKYLLQLSGLHVRSYLEIGVRHGGSFVATVELLNRFFPLEFAVAIDILPAPSMTEYMTFQELLARVREAVLGAYQHQDLPFDMLVEALAVPREANTTPVFQVVFAYQNVPAPEWTFPGLTVDAGNIHNGTAQFELTLVMWETDDGFRGSLEYDTDLFDPETIAQFARSFGFVLEAVTQNPDQCLARVPLLSEGERRRIVEEFNQTAQEYPRDQTIHRLFEAQAQQTPEATALVFEHEGR